MDNLNTLILNTINNILQKDKSFSKYSKPYLFTTENIKGYYQLLDFNNKDILTVCSSGDHILNAILCGAIRVDSFDINYFQKLVFDLKRVAIRYFNNVNDFKDFFLSDNHFLNKEDYNKMRDYFDIDNLSQKESKDYWDKVINELSNLYCVDRIFKCYSNDKFYTRKNMYLDCEQYTKLRKKINNVETNFINCNIIQLKDKFDYQYDLILLSNIADYLENIFDSNHLEKYHNLIVDEISKLLKQDGQIVSAYLYYYKFFQSDKYISNPVVRREMFNDFNLIPVIHELEVNDDSEDAIMVYKK